MAAVPSGIGFGVGGSAAITVSFAVPEMTGSVCGTVALISMGSPTVNAVASPLKPGALLMLATGGVSNGVVQVTDVVRSCVVASVYVPVAINC